MPPSKKLTVAVGAGVVRSVRKAARDRNESVDRFVRRVLWHYCMGWADDRSVILAEANRVATGVVAGFQFACSVGEPNPIREARRQGAEEVQRAIYGLPSRRRRR